MKGEGEEMVKVEATGSQTQPPRVTWPVFMGDTQGLGGYEVRG